MTKDSKFNATCCVLIVGIDIVFFMTEDFEFISCDVSVGIDIVFFHGPFNTARAHAL